MNNILDHFLEFGAYTDPGLFRAILKKDLPDDVRKFGLLVRKQLIHRTTLKNGNTGSNKDLRYGDMTKVPWYRQAEDDILPTVSAMLAELYRRDKRGFTAGRHEKDKLILTCRFVSILIASILKSKGIPARARSGFAPYFHINTDVKADAPRSSEVRHHFRVESLETGKSYDHWINQYWNGDRWVTIDVDGSLEGYLKFDPYDMPEEAFDFAADAWLAVRKRKIRSNHFQDAVGFRGLITIGWQLFHDFHSLMNNEIIYQQGPSYVWGRMNKLTKNELKEIDSLAKLMQKPDDNLEKLKEIWETDRKFRLLRGGLL